MIHSRPHTHRPTHRPTHKRPLARRPLLAAALGLAASLVLGTPGAQAQSASAAADAPLRIVVGYPPGGSSDRVARIVADKLQAKLAARSSSRTRRVRAAASRPST